MKNLFKKQIEQNNIITNEILEKLKVKKYDNGDDVKVGDKILYALLQGDILENLANGVNVMSSKVIILKEEHFNLYTYDERMEGGQLPTILLKK